LSERGTLQWAEDVLVEFKGLDIGRDLGGGNVQFRDLSNGQFTFSSDFWTYFRENYEELKAEGAFS
jgi:hypothetical protein